MEKFLSLVVVFCAGFIVCDFMKPATANAVGSEQYDIKIASGWRYLEDSNNLGKQGYEIKQVTFGSSGYPGIIVMQKRIR